MDHLPIDGELYKILREFAPCFTKPSFENFVIVVCGWIQCVKRHTITGMMEAAGVVQTRHHEGFHRFFSAARWDVDRLGRVVFEVLMRDVIAPEAVIDLAGDDTLAKKTGRKVFGAGYWRDAVLSKGKRVVTRWGLNFVVLGVIVEFAAWPGRKVFFPILARLHRKGGPTCSELFDEMVGKVAGWKPERRFEATVDGGYANHTVVGGLPENVELVSRVEGVRFFV